MYIESTQLVYCRYELPDDHPILSGVISYTSYSIKFSSMQLYSLMFITLQFEKREPDDDCPYLLAISQTGKKSICHLWKLSINVSIKILF